MTLTQDDTQHQFKRPKTALTQVCFEISQGPREVVEASYEELANHFLT